MSVFRLKHRDSNRNIKTAYSIVNTHTIHPKYDYERNSVSNYALRPSVMAVQEDKSIISNAREQSTSLQTFRMATMTATTKHRTSALLTHHATFTALCVCTGIEYPTSAVKEYIVCLKIVGKRNIRKEKAILQEWVSH